MNQIRIDRTARRIRVNLAGATIVRLDWSTTSAVIE